MWLEEYKPTEFSEFIGNYANIKKLCSWYENPKDIKIVVITGDSGVGKTLLVDLFIKTYKFTAHVINTNQEKSLNKLKDKVIETLTFRNILEVMYHKRLAVIIDDIDIYMNNKSSIADLIKIIKKYNKNKIVFIIGKKIIEKTIKSNKHICLLSLDKPTFVNCNIILHKIKNDKKLTLEYKELKAVYDYNNGDIRGMINMLYELSLDKTKNLETKNKDINYHLYEIINQIMYEKTSINKLLDIAYDTFFLPTIIYDNMDVLDLKDYSKCMENYLFSNYLYYNTNEYKINDELSILLKIGYVNHFTNMKKTKYKKIVYSKLLNNKQKIINGIKLQNSIKSKININYLIEIIDMYERIDKKNKNEENIDNLKIIFEENNLDYKKILKIKNK